MGSEAELLDRAADRLDGLLAGTTTGRWQVDGPWWHPVADGEAEPAEMVTAGEDRAAVLLGAPNLGAGRDSWPDLRYVVAMQPAVGRALAGWLRAAAQDSRTLGGADPDAVSVARATMGDEGEG